MPYKDPERKREYNKRWRAENREKQREYDKRWRAENREAMLESKRRYYEENREVQLEYQRRLRFEALDAYCEANPPAYFGGLQPQLTREEKLRRMAEQTASPREAEIARELLGRLSE